MNLLYQWAAVYAQGKPVACNVRLSHRIPRDVIEMEEVCLKHNLFELYLWLSLRFPQYFIEKESVIEQKQHALKLVHRSLHSKLFIQTHSYSSSYTSTRNAIRLQFPDDVPAYYGDRIQAETQQNLMAIEKSQRIVLPLHEVDPSHTQNYNQQQTNYQPRRAYNKVSPSQHSQDVMATGRMRGSVPIITGDKRVYIPRESSVTKSRVSESSFVDNASVNNTQTTISGDDTRMKQTRASNGRSDVRSEKPKSHQSPKSSHRPHIASDAANHSPSRDKYERAGQQHNGKWTAKYREDKRATTSRNDAQMKQTRASNEGSDVRSERPKSHQSPKSFKTGSSQAHRPHSISNTANHKPSHGTHESAGQQHNRETRKELERQPRSREVSAVVEATTAL